MFGALRDKIVNSSIDNLYEEKTLKVISHIGNAIFGILDIFSGLYYRVSGLENIQKDKTFILISNHPGPLDFFPIFNALEQAGVKVDFLAHRNLLHHPLTKKFSEQHHLIGVRRFDYKNRKKIPGANRENIKGLREGVRRLKDGRNLGVFISGEGYIKGYESIFAGYKFLAKHSGVSTFLPVLIEGNNITFLPPQSIPELSDESFALLEQKLRKTLTTTETSTSPEEPPEKQ